VRDWAVYVFGVLGEGLGGAEGVAPRRGNGERGFEGGERFGTEWFRDKDSSKETTWLLGEDRVLARPTRLSETLKRARKWTSVDSEE
jgi:hypothetical protein